MCDYSPCPLSSECVSAFFFFPPLHCFLVSVVAAVPAPLAPPPRSSVITCVPTCAKEREREKERRDRIKRGFGEGGEMKTDGIAERWRCKSERRGKCDVLKKKGKTRREWWVWKDQMQLTLRRPKQPVSFILSLLSLLSLSLSLSLSLPPLFPYVLFLEVSLSQIKALNQNLSKSRMLRAMSFTPNRARARTHTHTTLSVTMTMCLHQTWRGAM